MQMLAQQDFDKCNHTKLADSSVHYALAGVGKSSLINSLKLQEAGAECFSQDASEASQPSIDSLASVLHGHDTGCQVCSLSGSLVPAGFQMQLRMCPELFSTVSALSAGL